MSKYADTALLSGLLGMSPDRPDRLRTLRFTQSRDPSGRSHPELVRIFCETELALTTQKLATLKQKTAKNRHLRAAIDVMVEAGAHDHAADVLASATAFLARIHDPVPEVPIDVDLERQHLVVVEREVLILQALPGGTSDERDLVFGVFDAARQHRRDGSQWWAFADSDRLHVHGKTTWLGLSNDVPPPVVDAIQTALDAEGRAVERELGRALQLDLTPFARLSDDGLEILVPAALAGDPTRKRIVDRAGLALLARGYRVKPPRPSLF